jgi:hypothetical protein
MGYHQSWQTRQSYLDGIPHIIADKTVGFGWDSTPLVDKSVGFGCDSANHGRQDSRIWKGFRKSWQTRELDLDLFPHIMIDKTVGFGWDSANHGVQRH